MKPGTLCYENWMNTLAVLLDGNQNDDAASDTIHASEKGSGFRASSTFEVQRRCWMGQVIEN